jgi:hypothetical protein
MTHLLFAAQSMRWPQLLVAKTVSSAHPASFDCQLGIIFEGTRK